MRDSDRKEAFSLAYVRAVACAAGFVADRPPEPDRDSVDLIVRSVGPGGVANRRQIEMQVKSTATPILSATDLAFDLPKKNYDDLRCQIYVPQLLVVVLLAPLIDGWIAVAEERICTMFGAVGYWLPLEGRPPAANEERVRLHIPRGQVFDLGAVTRLMAAAGWR